MDEKNEILNENKNLDNIELGKFSLIKYQKNYYIDYYYNKDRYDLEKKEENNFIKLLENIVEFIFDKFSKWVSIIGPLFVNAFLCFFYLVYHSFLYNLIPFWSSYFYTNYSSPILYHLLYIIICPLYTLIYIQMVLYYILTAIIKPGSIDDLKKSIKFKKKLNPYFCYEKK